MYVHFEKKIIIKHILQNLINKGDQSLNLRYNMYYVLRRHN